MTCTRKQIDNFVKELGLRKPKFDNGTAKINLTWDEHSACNSKLGTGSAGLKEKILEMLPNARISNGYGGTCYCRIEVDYKG